MPETVTLDFIRKHKSRWPLIACGAIAVSFGLWWLAWQQQVDTTIHIPIQWGRFAAEQLPTAPARSDATYSTGATRTRSSSDVVAVAARLSGTSFFNTLLVSTGVAAEIRDKADEEFTLFIPTDGSISQLPLGTIRGLSRLEQQRLARHHVIVGRAVDVESQTSGSMQSLAGETLNFSYGENKLPMIGNAIVVGEYFASNGVVYLVENVLFPPLR